MTEVVEYRRAVVHLVPRLTALDEEDVTAADREAPESWCVVGNCFSLQKEHETAMRFFKRAIQLDPTFTRGTGIVAHAPMV